MDDRKVRVLKSIIEQFVDSADPVGSNALLSSGDFKVSSATIRNDMAYLESIGLIYQPHTSSGRVPTMQGFRMFVDEIMDDFSDQAMEKQMAIEDINKIHVNQLDFRIRNAISVLSNLSQSVAFATLPWMNESYYLGLKHVLREKEFESAVQVSTIVEVLEDKDEFIKLLTGLEIDRDVKAYIGDENAIPGIKSCTMLVVMYERGSYRGAIGILGPTRMRYAYNMKLLEKLRDDIES